MAEDDRGRAATASTRRPSRSTRRTTAKGNESREAQAAPMRQPSSKTTFLSTAPSLSPQDCLYLTEPQRDNREAVNADDYQDRYENQPRGLAVHDGAHFSPSKAPGPKRMTFRRTGNYGRRQCARLGFLLLSLERICELIDPGIYLEVLAVGIRRGCMPDMPSWWSGRRAEAGNTRVSKLFRQIISDYQNSG